MHTRKHPINPCFIVLTVSIMLSFMCGCTTAVQTLPAPTERQENREPTKLPQKTKNVLPTKKPLPTKTKPPDLKPTPVPLGLSRINPYPSSTVASVPNWDIQVVEVKRGEDAWQELQAADSFNEAAPEGMQYLLVKLHVKSTYTDSDEHSLSSCDFSVTGDHLVNYTCGSAAEFEPSLDASVTTGGETEGWATYLVARGEKNLMLVFQELLGLDENAIRYIALDQGASISIPPDLADIKPDDMGLTRADPALRTAKLTTQDWILTVNEVVRGEDAWAMLQDVNEFNNPPAEGMEYIAVKVHVRYIGTAEKAGSLDGSFFKSTGSANLLYDYPFMAEPDPPLDISLFPGGEYEGWLVLQAGQDETGVMLVFTQVLENGDEDQRFISLEP
jgi:hypothetical protein